MALSALPALLLPCLALAALPAHAGRELLYIGTRSAPAPAAASGIYAAFLDPASGRLDLVGQVAAVDRAQWLTLHPRLPVLYAVAEGPEGAAGDSQVIGFAVDSRSGALRLMDRADSGGRDATHLALDVGSSTLFAANHGSDTGSPPPLVSGSLGVLPLHADGSLAPLAASFPESGSGPDPRRQRNAQVHGVAVAPGRHYVLTADLGADRIFLYRFDPARRALEPAGSESLPPGSGPRHLLFHPNGRFLYVNTELTAHVQVFGWDGQRGRLRALQSVDGYPAGYAGTVARSSAEIVLSRNGRFLYLSLRGDQNSIVVYAVDGHSGHLTQLQRIPSGGEGSRAVALDPTGRWLLAAQDSGAVTELAVDPSSGRLNPTANVLTIPRPAALAFYPH